MVTKTENFDYKGVTELSEVPATTQLRKDTRTTARKISTYLLYLETSFAFRIFDNPPLVNGNVLAGDSANVKLNERDKRYITRFAENRRRLHMLTRKRLPLLIVLICCIELLIYLWSVWTSTFPETNYFAIHSAVIFDKCARLAGRVSSVLIFIALLMVGYNGLRKIYAEDKKRDSFLILMTLFTVNHLIHLLFVILRFRSHGESISLFVPISPGGAVHGLITFSCIVIVPFILWKNKHISKLLYSVTILHLLNVSYFMIETFLGKIKLPDRPAYHNQLGIVALTAACLYILYRVYMENKQKLIKND